MRKVRYRSKTFSCLDCKTPFQGKSGCNSKYCHGCRKVVCICSYCQKDFSVSRKDFNGGRGLYCSLSCYRVHLAVLYPRGEQHPRWTGGMNPTIARRARLRGAIGTHTNSEWAELKRKYNFMCLCCKQQEPFIKLTEDHIIPLSRGGTNDIANIQPLCGSCNRRKHTRTVNYIELYVETIS